MNSRSNAKAEIEKLVQYFEKNIHHIKHPSFNEAQARQLLIDPFFEALGWDVRNKNQSPPYALEVMPEGRVRTWIGKEPSTQYKIFTAPKKDDKESLIDYISDDEYKADVRMASKKPDYRFRIGGATKFFVEAKKPSVDLQTNLDAIFQIKRYGFSARVPISILTDFEEFRVFDCTRKPFYDKPKVGVMKEFDFTCKQYADVFDVLYDTFSREAVATGSLETVQRKYLMQRKGDFELDKSFLDDLSQWRIELAQDIAKHPKNRRILTSAALNECVQRILDRIIFFRVCEDRGIEETGTLLAILRIWQDHPALSLYEQFNKLIHQRRALYNGLLFAEHESERIHVDDKILEKIFTNINYPNSPYHFEEIGVEILGSIYERFLGKTIRLTAKQVRVEEKPEVRKAGGVYYTPKYIVDYIVEHTVGTVLYRANPSRSVKGHGDRVHRLAPEAKDRDGNNVKLTPKQVAKLKIIDIACGSGSFLLGAFQKLIDYHVEYYTAHPKEIQEENGMLDAYRDANGQLRLSAKKKREILLNNIYGVDIDPQAVEVTQMSLYLKVLEDENDTTLNKQTTLALHDVLLPSLKQNIKCGNSLIGSDFKSQEEMFNSDELQKIRPFDWDDEFPEIMRAGGFDCVIGNPPYLYSAGQNFATYFKSKYHLTQYQTDYYVYFIERSLSLLKEGGKFSYIISDSWLNSDSFSNLRKELLTNHRLERLAIFDYPVFEDAVLENSIVVLTSNIRPSKFEVDRFLNASTAVLLTNIASKEALHDGIIDPWKSPTIRELLAKVGNNKSILSSLVRVNRGIHAYRTDGYGRSKFGKGFQTKRDKEERSYHSRKKIDSTYLPEFKGKDIFRFSNKFSGEYLSYGPWLAESREREFFYKAKIALRKILSSKLHASLLLEPAALDQSLYILISNDDGINLLKHILGVLSSSLGAWYLRTKYSIRDSLYPWYTKKQLSEFPIVNNNDRLISLVDRMLELNKQLDKAHFDSEREPIERQIKATDRKIDELVYALYELTEEEIKIVEGEKG